MNSDSRWQVVQGFEFFTYGFDDEVVIYHTGSGHTHLLNSLQSEVFNYLQQQTSTLPELTSHLESVFDINSNNGLPTEVEKLLLSLYRFDIVEPYLQ